MQHIRGGLRGIRVDFLLPLCELGFGHDAMVRHTADELLRSLLLVIEELLALPALASLCVFAILLTTIMRRD